MRAAIKNGMTVSVRSVNDKKSIKNVRLAVNAVKNIIATFSVECGEKKFTAKNRKSNKIHR